MLTENQTRFIPLCHKYLPAFAVCHIGFTIAMARKFLAVPNISMSLVQEILLGPLGKRFIRDVRNDHRALFVWTVNQPCMMRWSIRKQVDGVITDEPGEFLEICRQYRQGEPDRLGFMDMVNVIRIQLLTIFFGLLFMWRLSHRLDKRWTETSTLPSQ